jgi:hypothetical protein
MATLDEMKALLNEMKQGIDKKFDDVMVKLKDLKDELGEVKVELGEVKVDLGEVKVQLKLVSSAAANQHTRLLNQLRPLGAALVPLPFMHNGAEWPADVEQPPTATHLAVSGSEKVPGKATVNTWTRGKSKAFLNTAVGTDVEDGASDAGSEGDGDDVRLVASRENARENGDKARARRLRVAVVCGVDPARLAVMQTICENDACNSNDTHALQPADRRTCILRHALRRSIRVYESDVPAAAYRPRRLYLYVPYSTLSPRSSVVARHMHACRFLLNQKRPASRFLAARRHAGRVAHEVRVTPRTRSNSSSARCRAQPTETRVVRPEPATASCTRAKSARRELRLRSCGPAGLRVRSLA